MNQSETITSRKEYSIVPVLRIIFRQKKLFLIIGIIAVIGSFIFTLPFFIKPQYKSSIKLLPAISYTTNLGLIFSQTTELANIIDFGIETDLDRLVSVIGCDALKASIIRKFNLKKHYKISPSDKEGDYKISKKLEHNIETKITPNRSVVVTIWDENPDMAAAIANAFIYYADSIQNAMVQKNKEEIYSTLKKQTEEKSQNIKNLTDSLNILRKKYKIYDATMLRWQSRTAKTDETLKSTLPSLSTNPEQLKSLEEGYDAITQLETKLEYESKYLTDLNHKLEEAETNMRKTLNTLYVIDRAYPDSKKAYPKRILIMAITLAASIFFTFIFILFYEKHQGIKEQL